MNRGSILNLVLDQCRKQDVHGRVDELVIKALPDFTTAKQRSVFIVGGTPEGIAEIQENTRERLLDHPQYEMVFLHHGTVEKPKFDTSQIPLSLNRLENNFRCRLLRFGQMDFRSSEEFSKFIMRSTWRVLITKREEEFFVRRDIYPTLWHPGSSIAGIEQYSKALDRELRILTDAGMVDNFSDVIKCFANSTGEQFREIDNGEVNVSILETNFDAIFTRLDRSYRDFWV